MDRGVQDAPYDIDENDRHLAARLASCCSLGELIIIVAIPAGNAFIVCHSAVLVFCCCRLLECVIIV